MKKSTFLLSLIGYILLVGLISCDSGLKDKRDINWKHLSTVNGDLAIPNQGDQQTATAIIDVDNNGVNDFIITERTQAPSVILYRHISDGWVRYIVDNEPLAIEAGSAVYDIDNDGDQDVVFGGDYRSNKVWWWENPYPELHPDTPWIRREIKSFGANKHHDQMFGDFDGDGQEELVFWNQNALTLYLAEIPSNPKNVAAWDVTEIYSWTKAYEPPQRGEYPQWKSPNEHEGLAKADIDGDGKLDIVGGGRWFKHDGGTNYTAHIIDDSYVFSRSAAGQLTKGGRPEVVLVVGDGRGPLMMYQWKDEAWVGKELVAAIQDGHSLDLIDFDGDGNLDIFNAEMRLGQNLNAIARLLFGDGKGNFTVKEVLTGFGIHEGRMVDLDGDGNYDILGKPYHWEAPRLDIWLNEGK